MSTCSATPTRSSAACGSPGRRPTHRPRGTLDDVRPSRPGPAPGRRFLQDRYRRARRRPIGVFARLAALEEEVQEQRQLNRRLAELTDVVAELLVPLADRDEEWAREVVSRYRVEL